ncbi:MAG TPA: aldose epimerase family protein [Bryobacteraceae bacterium]|nr:aldose epimerase family protein [Bryobacteraceae bacterium]
MRKLHAAMLILTASMTLPAKSKITRDEWGKTSDGVPVQIYTLTNSKGLEARITNYGGIVVSLKAPDRKGAMADVVLGFDSFAEYLANPGPHFGALIGRFGNRIGDARFSLDGIEYKLAKNNGQNSLHGGTRGFDKVVWTPGELSDGGLELAYLSKDGEENYPGNLKVTVAYHLTDANELKIDYAAATDKDTVLNLTNHSYFNLKGAGNGDILNHQVTIYADRFTPVDAGLIPTGELRDVSGTPFDFRKPTAIGARIDHIDEQLKLGRGYDHNWVLNSRSAAPTLAARVEEPSSGRVLEVLTDQPGIQFYTSNGLDGSIKGKGGKAYGRRGGLCLETQHFPDSPNKPQFPSTILKPGQKFHTVTVFRFTVN